MPDTFYTSVNVYGSKILYRGVEASGKRIKNRLDYSPVMFVPSQTDQGYYTIRGECVGPIQFSNIKDAKEFIANNEYSNYPISGMNRFEYAFISDHFPGEVPFDKDYIVVANMDIEVGSENGFPVPELANEEVTAITIKTRNGYKVFGLGEFHHALLDVDYVKCAGEHDLLLSFLTYWEALAPDIITGWNVRFFDIPYLINRIKKILGDSYTKKMSPFEIIHERKVQLSYKEAQSYNLVGVATLDYIELYKKFAPGGQSRESYTLDSIANHELGERKISYAEYGNLTQLYKKNHQLFIEYNIRDVELIERIDAKHNLIDLALTLAYNSKSNFDDVFAQVRMWDSLIYNKLRERNIVIPPLKRSEKDDAYVGAYVKDPISGMHKWVVSFDLNSLYPHLIMQYSISPDSFIFPEHYTPIHRKILSQKINVDSMLEMEVDTKLLREARVTLTPNGQLFDVSSRGFLAEMMQDMYDGRSKYKKMAIEAKKDLQKETDPVKRYEIEKRVSKYNNLQLAMKVSLNSAYGALGNEFFRHFDIRQASAITTSGQLSIRWIEKKLNAYLNKLLGTTDHDYVIASDTDSIYLSLDMLITKTILEENPMATSTEIIDFMDKVCEQKIQPFIDKSYKQLAAYTNAFENKMVMKRESLAEKGLWTAKKRYVLLVHNEEGVAYKEPKLKIMGLEVVRSSTPTVMREKIKEAINIIMNKDEKSLVEFIADFRKEYKNYEISDIAFPRGVNGIEKYSEGLDEWKAGTPIHVRGAIVYNSAIIRNKLTKKYPLITEGEKIKFIYLKEHNPLQSNVIAFPKVIPKELDLDKYIDYNLQFEKSFVEPVQNIIDVLGWRTEKRNKLSSFMSN